MPVKCVENCTNSPGSVGVLWDQRFQQTPLFMSPLLKIMGAEFSSWVLASLQGLHSMPQVHHASSIVALTSDPRPQDKPESCSQSHLSKCPLQPQTVGSPEYPTTPLLGWPQPTTTTAPASHLPKALQSLMSQAASASICCNLRAPLKPCTLNHLSQYLLEHQPARHPGTA